MRTRLGILLVAAFVVAIGACSDDSGSSAADDETTTTESSTTTDESTATTGASADCAADDADPDELERLITADVPSGFEEQPDDVGDTGPSDIAKAIRDDGEDDAEQVLTELRFRRGYQRLWATEDGDQLVVFVYEFCSPDEVAQYLQRSQQLFATPDSGLTTYTVASPKGAVGFRGVQGAEGQAIVLVPDGAYLLQTVAYDPAASTVEELSARAEALAAAQHTSLAA